MNAIVGIKVGDRLYWKRPDSFGKSVMSLVEVVDIKQDLVIIRYSIGSGPCRKLKTKAVSPESLSIRAGNE